MDRCSNPWRESHTLKQRERERELKILDTLKIEAERESPTKLYAA